MAIVTRVEKFFKCDVCGHEWQSRDGHRPLRCAGCKTPYWSKDKTVSSDKK